MNEGMSYGAKYTVDYLFDEKSVSVPEVFDELRSVSEGGGWGRQDESQLQEILQEAVNTGQVIVEGDTCYYVGQTNEVLN